MDQSQRLQHSQAQYSNSQATTSGTSLNAGVWGGSDTLLDTPQTQLEGQGQPTYTPPSGLAGSTPFPSTSSHPGSHNAGYDYPTDLQRGPPLQHGVMGYSSNLGAQGAAPGYPSVLGAQGAAPGYPSPSGAQGAAPGYPGAQGAAPGYPSVLGAQGAAPGYPSPSGAQGAAPGYPSVLGAQGAAPGYPSPSGAQGAAPSYPGAQGAAPGYPSVLGAAPGYPSAQGGGAGYTSSYSSGAVTTYPSSQGPTHMHSSGQGDLDNRTAYNFPAGPQGQWPSPVYNDSLLTHMSRPKRDRAESTRQADNRYSKAPRTVHWPQSDESTSHTSPISLQPSQLSLQQVNQVSRVSSETSHTSPISRQPSQSSLQQGNFSWGSQSTHQHSPIPTGAPTGIQASLHNQDSQAVYRPHDGLPRPTDQDPPVIPPSQSGSDNPPTQRQSREEPSETSSPLPQSPDSPPKPPPAPPLVVKIPEYKPPEPPRPPSPPPPVWKVSTNQLPTPGSYYSKCALGPASPAGATTGTSSSVPLGNTSSTSTGPQAADANTPVDSDLSASNANTESSTSNAGTTQGPSASNVNLEPGTSTSGDTGSAGQGGSATGSKGKPKTRLVFANTHAWEIQPGFRYYSLGKLPDEYAGPRLNLFPALIHPCEFNSIARQTTSIENMLNHWIIQRLQHGHLVFNPAGDPSIPRLVVDHERRVYDQLIKICKDIRDRLVTGQCKANRKKGKGKIRDKHIRSISGSVADVVQLLYKRHRILHLPLEKEPLEGLSFKWDDDDELRDLALEFLASLGLLGDIDLTELAAGNYEHLKDDIRRIIETQFVGPGVELPYSSRAIHEGCVNLCKHFGIDLYSILSADGMVCPGMVALIAATLIELERDQNDGMGMCDTQSQPTAHVCAYSIQAKYLEITDYLRRNVMVGWQGKWFAEFLKLIKGTLSAEADKYLNDLRNREEYVQTHNIRGHSF